MKQKNKRERGSILKYIGVKFRKAFFTGILVITPLAVTIWILANLFEKVDGLLGELIIRVLGRRIPGLGVLLLVILVIVVGVFARNYIGGKLIRWGNLLLFKIPLFNKIYIALKQIFEVFLGERNTIFQRVVLFQYPRLGIYSIGFVTSKGGGEVQANVDRKLLHIFLPTTPNPTSGFLLFVPEEDTIALEMSVEEGIKLVISGGAVIPEYVEGKSQPVEISGHSFGEANEPDGEIQGGPREG
jgi:uncharacterized membrane protein